MKSQRAWRQMALQARPGTRGGIRRGAGRPEGRTTVARTGRPRLSGREVLHITLKLRADAPRLRRHSVYDALRRSFALANRRDDFRLCHYSVQSNHLHLVCEADSQPSLSRGMQGLAISIARRLNSMTGRRGTFFADRYHLEVLTSPRQVRNVLVYVLRNSNRHGVHPPGVLDLFSSSLYFDGWRERLRIRLFDDDRQLRPVRPPTRWLLTTGWRRGGPIGGDELPAGSPPEV